MKEPTQDDWDLVEQVIKRGYLPEERRRLVALRMPDAGRFIWRRAMEPGGAPAVWSPARRRYIDVRPWFLRGAENASPASQGDSVP